MTTPRPSEPLSEEEMKQDLARFREEVAGCLDSLGPDEVWTHEICTSTLVIVDQRDRAVRQIEALTRDVQMLRDLQESTAPFCGHLSAFLETLDGGTTIHCLKCDLAAAQQEIETLKQRIQFNSLSDRYGREASNQ